MTGTIETRAHETAREYIQRHAIDRATFQTDDAASTARSFANMEDDLQREYFGRFLIELIQNARDAWMGGRTERPGGVLRITLTDEPALVVCNEGDPISPEVVIHSIAKYGESSKPYGSGIGYKGIGFKSVLEISLTPELYSRPQPARPWDIAVQFDPDEGRRMLDRYTPDWREMLAGLPGSAGRRDGSDRVPVLYFPQWIDDAAMRLRGVDAFDGHSFNTIVRLPFDARFEDRLGLTRDAFVVRVQTAMAELTDEIVLLLGAFEKVLLEDEIAGTRTTLSRVTSDTRTIPERGRVSTVEITRNGSLSSRWLLFEAEADELLDGAAPLERAISVAARLAAATPPDEPTRLAKGTTADAFHLFFPTRILTHLPFLFHAYFEVDVSRTSFARSREARNAQLLGALRRLTVTAVRHLAGQAQRGRFDLRSLVALLADDDADPDDELAKSFRSDLLAILDREVWIHAASPDDSVALAAPVNLLVDPRVQDLLPVAFPSRYVQERLGLAYPDGELSEASLRFLAKRAVTAAGTTESRTTAGGLVGERFRALLTPGELEIWPETSEDDGFRALLQMLQRLRGLPPFEVDGTLATLAGERAARFIPVVTDDPNVRRMRAPASGARRDKAEVGTGPIMARIRARAESELAPPPALGVDFLADGVADQSTLDGVGATLGVRPMTTAAVLDALQATDWSVEDGPTVLRFAWRLLLRERESAFSIREARAVANATFEPGRWYWARRGRGRSDNELAEQRRERGLSRVLVPTRADGVWRPAGDLVFGADWAEWLEAFSRGGSVAADRAMAYRDLDDIGRPSGDYLAGPDTFAALLQLDPGDLAGGDDQPDPSTESADDHLGLLHAFLLRLGAWEVPPLEEINDYTERGDAAFDPWSSDPDRPAHRKALDAAQVEFSSYGHQRTHVAEDYRLRWQLESTAAFVRGLSNGADLYQACGSVVLFCTGCRTHRTRQLNNEPTRQPSLLLHILRRHEWVPVTIGGRAADPASPRQAWFDAEPPDASRIAQSPRRFLALATSDVTARLADLARIARVETASEHRIRTELGSLRDAFLGGEVAADRRATGIEGQAFAGLHREFYERLATLSTRAGDAAPVDIGSVLAVRNRHLEFRAPIDCRHDDGRFAPLKGSFLSRVPFVVLNREQTTVARAISVPAFELVVTRRPSQSERDVTDQVRPLIQGHAAELLAIQAFHPLGAQPLELGSRAFRERAERLANLSVIQVDDLVLDVVVDGLEIRIQIGAGGDQDMFLEGATTSAPVLYHDLRGDGWEGPFTQRVGTHLAVLLGNANYAATFRILLQQETPADREAFLAELGIFDEQLDQVTAQLRTGTIERRAEERRWWNALLPLVGAPKDPVPGDADPTAAAHGVLSTLGLIGLPDGTWESILNAGGGPQVRRDSSPRGTLALLESTGMDLRALNEELVAAHVGDGLSIDVAPRELAAWRSANGRHVATVLALRDRDPAVAKSMPGSWHTPEALRFRVTVRASDYLAPVIADLAAAGLIADADQLAGRETTAYLASLVGLSVAELERQARLLYSDDERRKFDRDHAVAYKAALKRIVVAARTSSGDLPSRIRSEGDAVDRELSALVETPLQLTPLVASALASRPELADSLVTAIRDWHPSMSAPSTERLYELAREFIDPPSHLDHVVAVLARERRQLADKVRLEIERVRNSGIRPRVPEGRSLPPPGAIRRNVQRPIGPRRTHDQRRKDQLGLQAEEVVRAIVLDRLLAMEPEELGGAVTSMTDLLRSVGTGAIVDSLVNRGVEALDEGIEEDDRLEALARFVHVAQESDDFGFDLLGWLAVAPGDERPLLLEVKSVGDRSFYASAPEWSRAEEQGSLYAFVCVHRPAGEADLDLLIDPARMLAEARLRQEADTWKVRY